MLYKPGEIPALTKEQLTQASLVSKLPKDFPFANWEGMTTKQQLQQMKYSGLNPQEQWSLLNASAPLKVLNEYNQAKDHAATQTSPAKASAPVSAKAVQLLAQSVRSASMNPSISPSLQSGVPQRKLEEQKENLQTKLLGKPAIAAANPVKITNPTKTPDGEKPVEDSRDTMEQKKDRIWDKIIVPTWREKREDKIWKPVKARDKTESFPKLDSFNDTQDQPIAKDKNKVDRQPNSKHIEMFNLGDPKPYRLSKGEYYYVDESAVIGGFVIGHTVIFNAEKYAEYKYVGYSVGKSLLPADHLWVKGYVNNIYEVDDFEGAFVNFAGGIGPFGSSASLGYNKDRQVYIVSASNVAQQLFAGAGVSVQYFTSLTPDWVLGEAPIRWGTTTYDWIFNNYYPQEV